jgi:iron complex transport system ATP-binding protein
MLSANAISFSINRKQLLKNASLDIKPGELTVILGPNGAGKSTFMKLLCGDLQPSSGRIALDDKPTQNWTRRSLAQRRAMMPQSSNVVFAFSALEIVMLGRSPHIARRESQRDQRIAETAMGCTGVSGLAARNYNTLSGGEQQRVQLARALCQIWAEDKDAEQNDSRYLLLDEPVASMDLAHQHETLHIAQQFAQRNVGVLVILHDINLAAMYADKIAIFEHGEIERQGSPNTVLDTELIREVFGIDAFFQKHPTLGCPLMVSMPKPANNFPSQLNISPTGKLQ